jgi:ribosomal protein S1
MTEEILEEKIKTEKKREPITDQAWWDELEYEDQKRKSFRNVKPVSKEDIEFYNLLQNIVVNDPKPGDVVKANYVGTDGTDYLFFYEGFKDQIRVESKPSEVKYIETIEKGTDVDVLIYEVNRSNFEIKGSISQLFESVAHNELANNPDVVVNAYVKDINPAGYSITIEYNKVVLPAFMPNTLAGINKLHNPESIVGTNMDVMIESFSKNEGTYIVSRRKYLKTLIPGELDKLLTNHMYYGSVTGTTPFGVFVEFGVDEESPKCLTGMIHKANIVPEWQDRIQEIKPGQTIEFYVKEIIKNNKIILTQILRETLWDNISNGQELSGIVKTVKAFGTLVVLDSETVGLIHTSEMEKAGVSFDNGDQVKVKVLAVDRPNRKIFLTTA